MQQQDVLRLKMKLIKKVIVECAQLCLSGCGATRSVSCVCWLPIYLDKRDVLIISCNLARDILKHNQQEAQLHG